MQTVTLKLPDDLSDWLEREAKKLNRPKSAVMREALTARRNGNGSGSLLDQAGDLVGRYASGIKDSSHKRHLKGLGS